MRSGRPSAPPRRCGLSPPARGCLAPPSLALPLFLPPLATFSPSYRLLCARGVFPMGHFARGHTTRTAGGRHGAPPPLRSCARPLALLPLFFHSPALLDPDLGWRDASTSAAPAPGREVQRGAYICPGDRARCQGFGELKIGRGEAYSSASCRALLVAGWGWRRIRKINTQITFNFTL